MTLCVAWIRTLKAEKELVIAADSRLTNKVTLTEELVVAADSRLTGGVRWDGCPKILTFSRGDLAICFTGNTVDAYPFLLQLQNAIDSNHKSRSRGIDLTEMLGHIERVFCAMREHVTLESEKPDIQFLVAGYSWKKEKFSIVSMRYNPKNRKRKEEKEKDFDNTFHNQYAFIGDAVPEAKKRLMTLLKSRKGAAKNITDLLASLDYEPFEVLRDIITEEISPNIGGPPQLVKIYKYMRTIPYAIYWPDREQVTLYGRPLLNYENHAYITLDPHTLETFQRSANLSSRSEKRERYAAQKVKRRAEQAAKRGTDTADPTGSPFSAGSGESESEADHQIAHEYGSTAGVRRVLIRARQFVSRSIGEGVRACMRMFGPEREKGNKR